MSVSEAETARLGKSMFFTIDNKDTVEALGYLFSNNLIALEPFYFALSDCRHTTLSSHGEQFLVFFHANFFGFRHASRFKHGFIISLLFSY